LFLEIYFRIYFVFGDKYDHFYTWEFDHA